MATTQSSSTTTDLSIFNELESSVRSYIRNFPTVFTRARGANLWDNSGTCYIDFFAGAGALNYGHNHPRLKAKLLEYLSQDGVVHSLDMGTAAKAHFLEQFRDIILQPRGMDYRVMFPGPTGTNAVESALKIARKATGRTNVVAFTNAFHGMTLGSLSVTGNRFKRNGAGVVLTDVVTVPYDSYLGSAFDSSEYLEQVLTDQGSGMSRPAAVIVETVQGEGGVHTARGEWLRAIADICVRNEIVLIVDDVQVGCGRVGTFFSFEEAGIHPDIVCLSKSISGYGLPMALTLISPELDVWEPGEHNGTFRGHNPAFVTAAEALEFWRTDLLRVEVQGKGEEVERRLGQIQKEYPVLEPEVRGRGMIWGLAMTAGAAERVSALAFERGLIVETSGPESDVVKLLPPLTIDPDTLEAGMDILELSVKMAAKEAAQ